MIVPCGWAIIDRLVTSLNTLCIVRSRVVQIAEQMRYTSRGSNLAKTEDVSPIDQFYTLVYAK